MMVFDLHDALALICWSSYVAHRHILTLAILMAQALTSLSALRSTTLLSCGKRTATKYPTRPDAQNGNGAPYRKSYFICLRDSHDSSVGRIATTGNTKKIAVTQLPAKPQSSRYRASACSGWLADACHPSSVSIRRQFTVLAQCEALR